MTVFLDSHSFVQALQVAGELTETAETSSGRDRRTSKMRREATETAAVGMLLNAMLFDK